jgi:hypothetical protein
MKMLKFISMKLLIFFSLFNINIVFAKYVSVGTFVHYFQKEQVSKTGSNKFFELNPYVGIGTNIHLIQKHFFVPELAYSYILSSEEDIKEDIIFLNYHFARPITQNFLLRYGLSTYWWRITGSGGRKRLRNGGGYTNFKLPNKTVTSYVTSLMLGAENFINSNRSIRFDINMMDSINDESKNFNYLLTINLFL